MKDITKDRIYCILGASSFLSKEGDRLAHTPVAVVTLVPDPSDDKGMEIGRYPGDREIRVHHELLVGTVDEIVMHFRKGLTRVYEAIVGGSGTDTVIPAIGTTDLSPQRQAFAKYFGGDKFHQLSPAPPGVFEAREMHRCAYNNIVPSQRPLTRMVLRQLLGQWSTHAAAQGFGKGGSVTTENYEVLQSLIAALQVMRDDRLAAEPKKTGGAEFVTTSVNCCARCGGNHADLVFRKMAKASDEWTHWTMCPTANEPIMLLVEQKSVFEVMSSEGDSVPVADVNAATVSKCRVRVPDGQPDTKPAESPAPDPIKGLVDALCLFRQVEHAAAGYSAVNQLMDMLVEVYQHVGNHMPAEKRHAVPPGLRDRIRDLLVSQGKWPVKPAATAGSESGTMGG